MATPRVRWHQNSQRIRGLVATRFTNLYAMSIDGSLYLSSAYGNQSRLGDPMCHVDGRHFFPGLCNDGRCYRLPVEIRVFPDTEHVFQPEFTDRTVFLDCRVYPPDSRGRLVSLFPEPVGTPSPLGDHFNRYFDNKALCSAFSLPEDTFAVTRVVRLKFNMPEECQAALKTAAKRIAKRAAKRR